MKRSWLPVLTTMLAVFSAPIAYQAKAQPQQPIPGKPTSSASHILNCMQPLGHHLYETEHSCPIGGERFRSLALGTHSTFGRYLDWKPISYMDFPAPVPVCPANGFVITKQSYSEDELKKYKAVIESEAYRSIYRTQHPSYYLLAKFEELAGEGQENRWWHLL
jgi:hypothetical protein